MFVKAFDFSWIFPEYEHFPSSVDPSVRVNRVENNIYTALCWSFRCLCARCRLCVVEETTSI